MTKLGALVLSAAFAAAALAPGMAAACMKNSVSAQGNPGGTPTTLVDGAGATTTTPITPLPETKTGG